ncbi:MAG: hypothetical protein ACOVNN_09190, partial [Limnohabitans sp.]
HFFLDGHPTHEHLGSGIDHQPHPNKIPITVTISSVLVFFKLLKQVQLQLLTLLCLATQNIVRSEIAAFTQASFFANI